MKIMLIFLAVVVILVVIGLLVALFVKKNYALQREVTIRKPKADVFNYIKYLKNQDNFSKWATMDPHMRKEYRGTDGTAGFVSAWDSDDKNVGKGEQEIVSISEGERVDFEIRFIKPFEAKAGAYMTTEAVSGNGQTKVTWGFKSSMKYPMNLMLLFMDMEKMVGNDLALGLTNLKSTLEK